MRSLTEEELRTFLSKLAIYCSSNLSELIKSTADDSNDENSRMVFRIQGNRVFYMPLRLANLATSIPRASLLSCGTMMGKFTKTGKFRLALTCLSVISPYSRTKIWIKPNGEMPFLYGSNGTDLNRNEVKAPFSDSQFLPVVKAHVGKISEDCPEHSGCIVYSMDDTPLGFGVTARSSAEMRKLEPTAIVLFRQADVGEYLREEDTLFTT
ncbi:60S ribosome subunit biogenesis protein NIP7 [Penicillium herquei]|nr:60S ribosome subunit biogenesis protein NIP7 [Penicillium herquei]